LEPGEPIGGCGSVGGDVAGGGVERGDDGMRVSGYSSSKRLIIPSRVWSRNKRRSVIVTCKISPHSLQFFGTA